MHSGDIPVFDAALEYGLDQDAVTEPAVEPPKVGMAARNARNRKQPEKYVPSCLRPSDQPRDAARQEECSDLDEKSLTTF